MQSESSESSLMPQQGMSAANIEIPDNNSRFQKIRDLFYKVTGREAREGSMAEVLDKWAEGVTPTTKRIPARVNVDAMKAGLQ